MLGPSVWLLSSHCHRCSRPQVLSGSLILQSPMASGGFTGFPICWWMPPGMSPSAAMAVRSVVTICGVPMKGVLPLSRLRAFSCSMEVPAQAPGAAVDEFLQAYCPPGLGARTEDPPFQEPLRVLSINCGGLTTKLPRLLVLLTCCDPDVVCLQETSDCVADPIPGIPYRVWVGIPVRGGGLAILVHRRCLPEDLRQISVDCGNHLLGVSIPVRDGFALSMANLHLPPRPCLPCVSGLSALSLCVWWLGHLRFCKAHWDCVRDDVKKVGGRRRWNTRKRVGALSEPYRLVGADRWGVGSNLGATVGMCLSQWGDKGGMPQSKSH